MAHEQRTNPLKGSVTRTIEDWLICLVRRFLNKGVGSLRRVTIYPQRIVAGKICRCNLFGNNCRKVVRMAFSDLMACRQGRITYGINFSAL